MTSIKNFFAVTFGIMAALILAPFVAFFGLMMLGLTFGLSLIAAGAVATWAREVEDAEIVTPSEDDVVTSDTEAQPA